MDFDSIMASLQPTIVVLAILAAAALYAQIRFCLWAAPKVARFFMSRGVR